MIIILICVFVGIMGRLIPHLPDMTPLTNLSLFAGSQLKRSHALIAIFFSLFISDFILNVFFHYPLFGYWSFFTYTGFATITLLGKFIGEHPSKIRLLYFVFTASVGFWLWTNFGVWLEGQLYPKTFQGLLTCYIFALPFLRNAIIGDLIWMVVIFGIMQRVVKPLHKTIEQRAS